MKKSVKSSEFWIALVTNLVGIAVIMGSFTDEQGAEITKSAQAIIGGVIAIATSLGYIKARVEIKKARANAAANGVSEEKLRTLGV